MKRIRVNSPKVRTEGLEPIDVELMLDSGAFGAWTRGQEIKVQDYIAFVKEYGHLFHSIVNLDVIPGDFGRKKTERDVEIGAERSYENLQEMKAAGIPAVPVFHQGEEWRHLDRLLEDGEPYIGISPSGDSISMNTGWFDQVFERITDSQGRPYVKTHGFGVTAVPVLWQFPWYSFDSVTWVIKSGYGCIFAPQPDPRGGSNYKEKPVSVWVTGSERKNDRYEIEMQGPEYMKLVKRFIESEVGTSLHQLRYDPYTRMEAMAIYYQNLSRLLKYAPYRKRGTFFPSGHESELPHWEMKKAIFAVGPTGNTRRSEILNRLGIKERLLSYFDLRDADPAEIFAYAKYGAVKAPGKRRTLRFKNWERAEYWNRRRIQLADRTFRRGIVPPYIDPKDEHSLKVIRKQLDEA